MSISKYNGERYPDPTAYAALSRIEKGEGHRSKNRFERPLVYICSPFRGDEERNVQAALRYCRHAILEGKMPIAPHVWLPRFLNDSDRDQRELALNFGKWLMRFCSELWVFGKHISFGMEDEIKVAKKRGIPIKYFTD